MACRGMCFAVTKKRSEERRVGRGGETKGEASRERFADVIREDESSPGLYELQSWLLLMSMVRLPTPPNKAPEPTPMSVTSPANVRRIEWLTLRHQPPVAGAAPAMGVAHL